MTSGDALVIIGGGIYGCMTAWALRKHGFAGTITLIERDSTYSRSSTALSAASIRSQFGCAVNVELSLYGATFLRDVGRHLGRDTDIGLVERGYLILCPTGAEAARRSALAMQRSLGADVELLTPQDLAARTPWLSTTDVAFATLGTSGEGWFDAWALLQAARRAALDAGVTIRAAEAAAIETADGRVTSVRLASGEQVPADLCLVAAGPLSGDIAATAGVALPVAPKKRTVFRFRAPLDGTDFPMLFDTSGAWMRPEGDGFIGGIQPPADADPDAHDDFEPHHALWETMLWPLLAARVPALEQTRLLGAWAGHYDMNPFDHNGVVGPHPDIPNLLFATGFSGHGLMHAPGVARGLAEWVTTGGWQSIDLSPLGFGRIPANAPLPETAIY